MRTPKHKSTLPPQRSQISAGIGYALTPGSISWNQSAIPDLNGVFEFYLSGKTSERQRKDAKLPYAKYVAEDLGNMKVDEITPFHINLRLQSLPEHLSAATRNRIRALIHRLLQIAVEYGFIGKNPCTVIKSLRENNVVERILTKQEMEAFIESCEQMLKEPAVLALLFALFTGIRIGNIMTIKRENLSHDSRQVYLPNTKSGKSLQLPLGESARRVVEQALTVSTNQYLFSSPIRPDHPISYPRNAFFRICQRAGISVNGALHAGRDGFPAEPITIHCLRKTFASVILEKTGDIYQCSKLLGHCDVKTTQRYAFYNQNKLQETVEDAFTTPLKKVC